MVIESAGNLKITLTFDAVQAQAMKLALYSFVHHSDDEAAELVAKTLLSYGVGPLSRLEVNDLLNQIVTTMMRVTLHGNNIDPSALDAIASQMVHNMPENAKPN